MGLFEGEFIYKIVIKYIHKPKPQVYYNVPKRTMLVVKPEKDDRPHTNQQQEYVECVYSTSSKSYWSVKKSEKDIHIPPLKNDLRSTGEVNSLYGKNAKNVKVAIVEVGNENRGEANSEIIHEEELLQDMDWLDEQI